MHQNHYFLKHLANELNNKLEGFRLLSCFSQSKDELIFGFSNSKSEFYIKADLSQQQGIVSFPKEFKRANRNTVDLFGELIGNCVDSIRSHQNERSFEIRFKEGPILVFKLFGRQNNILLFFGDSGPEIFKTRIHKDLDHKIEDFDRTLDQSEEHFRKSEGNLRSIFPTFGQILTDHLASLGYLKMNITDQWQLTQQLLHDLTQPRFYIVQYKGSVHLSMVPIGDIMEEYDSAIQASSTYYIKHLQINGLERERNMIIRQLEQKITRTGNYIIKSKARLNELSTKRNDQIADIIMANLHTIPSNEKEVELFDFYNNRQAKIRLNSKLSAQKNAEKYYQKSKNQSIEVRKITESIETKQKELNKAEKLLAEVKAFTELKQLRSKFKQDPNSPKPSKDLPYHQFEIDGFTVLVGKNAKSNDELTLKFAHKDDLWFHARDVAGSHVVLKYQSGKNFPAPVIERTAQLAAWHSKGKNFPLCPVTHTLKKFVRKPKGFAPGKVKVEREEVILVEPKNISI